MNNHLEPFEMTDGERMHPLWARLKANFETQLQSLRTRNDNPKLTEAETATLRGHIQCLRAVIALGDSRPQTGD